MMNEMFENEAELRNGSMIRGEYFPPPPLSISNNYNLKEQLDNLIGPVDFSYRLEAVNLFIGIVLSAILLLFFFI